MGRTRTVAAIAAALSLAPLSLAADDGAGSEVSFAELEVVVGAGSIDVTGVLDFDASVVVADDAAGDGLAAPAGTDITTATITQSDADLLTFRLELGSVPPEFSPAVAYVWPVLPDDSLQLVAWSGSTNGGGYDWVFSVVNANGSNSSDSPVDGAYADGAVEWYVSPAQISVRHGQTLGADEFGDPTVMPDLRTSLSTNNGTWVIAGNRFDDAANGTFFTVGGAARLVLRTQDGAYLMEEATRYRRGAFQGGFAGLEPGTYRLDVVGAAGDAEVIHTEIVTVPA